MSFSTTPPIDDEFHDFLTTKPWPPFESPSPNLLVFETPSAFYRATQIVPDIERMFNLFPDRRLNGKQDFEIDGEFYRLIIKDNEINLLEGHVVYK